MPPSERSRCEWATTANGRRFVVHALEIATGTCPCDEGVEPVG